MTILAKLLALLGCDSREEPPTPPVDIAPILDARAADYAREHGLALDWRTSVVDLMKALGMKSTVDERLDLAEELHYPGKDKDKGGLLNAWLHKEIMRRVAANGGKVPPELL